LWDTVRDPGKRFLFLLTGFLPPFIQRRGPRPLLEEEGIRWRVSNPITLGKEREKKRGRDDIR
jgi:hypothetical protein